LPLSVAKALRPALQTARPGWLTLTMLACTKSDGRKGSPPSAASGMAP
jgi:hypothetical protein